MPKNAKANEAIPREAKTADLSSIIFPLKFLYSEKSKELKKSSKTCTYVLHTTISLMGSVMGLFSLCNGVFLMKTTK